MFVRNIQEKRKYERYETVVGASLSFSGMEFKGDIKNMSLGGAFFMPNDTCSLNNVIPHVGSRGCIEIAIEMKVSGLITSFNCEVVYVIPNRGIAIKFINIEEVSSKSISIILSVIRSER